MTLTLVSTTPTDATTSVPLTQQIDIVVESNVAAPSIITGSINIDITTQGNPTPDHVVVDGVVQAGYLVNISTTPIVGGDQLLVEIVKNTNYNSYSQITVDLEVQDSNDTLQTSFGFTTEDVNAPVFENITPGIGSTNNSTNTPIFISIQDQGSGVQETSIGVTITTTTDEGSVATNAVVAGVLQSKYNHNSSITQIGNNIDMLLILNTGLEYPSGSTITVAIYAEDQDNSTSTLYSFDIIDLEPPTISNLVPAADATNINENTTITLAYSDPNGEGVDQTSINIDVNDQAAVRNGIPQLTFGTTNFISTPLSVIAVMTPANPLPSAADTVISTTVKDVKGNLSSLLYSFTVRDHMAPRFIHIRPGDGYGSILPNTNISFTILEDVDGYGVDFNTLSIEVDGYSVFDGIFEGYGTHQQDTVTDAYGNVLFRGYITTITQLSVNKYQVVVDPLTDFDFDTDVFVDLFVSDLGGHSTSFSFDFHIALEDELVTTAFPDTGTYNNFLDGYGLINSSQFLFQNGIILTTNMPQTTTYFTLDGTVPTIDACGIVRGTTRVYIGQPIKLQREGLHVLKFFSTDGAGNKEEVKQEVYMIKPLPPEALEVKQIRITTDIPFETTIIPVESTILFEEGQVVRILDDIRPPVFATILSVNSTSDPEFIIIDNPVLRLKYNRFARVEIIPQQVDPANAIEFDTQQLPEFLYIGSNGYGTEQADSVMEQFRILNKASTNEDILADFTLLAKGTKFFNSNSELELSSELDDLEKQRSNLPNNTLMLLDFDGNISNKPRQGDLANLTIPIVDKAIAANTAIFKIQVRKDEFVDRELLKKVLRNFAPVDLAIKVEFEEVD